jgi:hypothetical protein
MPSDVTFLWSQSQNEEPRFSTEIFLKKYFECGLIVTLGIRASDPDAIGDKPAVNQSTVLPLESLM